MLRIPKLYDYSLFEEIYNNKMFMKNNVIMRIILNNMISLKCEDDDKWRRVTKWFVFGGSDFIIMRRVAKFISRTFDHVCTDKQSALCLLFDP